MPTQPSKTAGMYGCRRNPDHGSALHFLPAPGSGGLLGQALPWHCKHTCSVTCCDTCHGGGGSLHNRGIEESALIVRMGRRGSRASHASPARRPEGPIGRAHRCPALRAPPAPGRAAVRPPSSRRPPPAHSPARPAALQAPRPPPQAASRVARAPRPRPDRLHPVAPRAPAASWPRASVRTAAGMLRAVGGGARAGAGLGPPTAVASGERGLRGTRAGPAGAL